MLNETIKTLRTSKGLSQEELAAQLHVVRQTVSKWEQGLSVPDAGMLLSLSEVLETPASTLLGEAPAETKADDCKAISEKLAAINRYFARRQAARRRAVHWLFILLGILTAAIFPVLIELKSPYLAWDYSHPETAVTGVVLHALEWLFIRAVPVVLIGSIAGVFLTRKRHQNG